MSFRLTTLGHGIGLRPPHYSAFLAGRAQVSWIEAISENFMGIGGRAAAVLERTRADRPVALHGVSMSIGAVDPLDRAYLRRLRELVDRVQPAIVSDHLCWGSFRGRYAHDLLPLPFTSEAVRHVVSRVGQIQEAIGRQILLENVSSYVAFRASEMTEWDFLAEVARRADCGILLDINNVYVSARNHRFDPRRYLDAIPVDRVGQFHLAGFTDEGKYLFDTHDHPVSDAVWSLHREAVRRFGRVPTLIEWDDRIPPLRRLLQESRRAEENEREALEVPRQAGAAS